MNTSFPPWNPARASSRERVPQQTQLLIYSTMIYSCLWPFPCKIYFASRSCAWEGATALRSHLHHGPLDAGALPQLHDRLDHGAAHVAAGENLPGLKHEAGGEPEAAGAKRREQGGQTKSPETELTFSLVRPSLHRRLDVRCQAKAAGVLRSFWNAATRM